MTKAKTRSRITDCDLRVDLVLPLDAALVFPSSDMVEDLLDTSAAEKIFRYLLGDETVDMLLAAVEERDPEVYQDPWTWERVSGWLVKASTPIRVSHEGNRLVSFSWAAYETRYFHAETYEDALEAAIVWAETDPPTAKL